MADTFCRIVDTTVCDNTLGSDACQAGFTTDSSTSFVVRAVCTTPNCTGTNLCFNIKASLDGHDIDASKSFIVPPSSTVTIKDTSGNYPLTYRCLDIFPFICETFCGTCAPVIQTCTVNDVTSGTPTATAELTCCACCNFFCSHSNRDMYFKTSNRCSSVHLRHDGNSVHCIRIYKEGNGQPCFDTSTNYCPITFGGGAVGIFNCCDLCILNTQDCSLVNQNHYTCCRRMCNHLGSDYTATSYARAGLSGRTDHPTCEGCRAALVWKGGAVGCVMSAFTFNLCDSGQCIASQLLWKKAPCFIYTNSTDSTTKTCFDKLAGSAFYLGIYYSERCSCWTSVAYSCEFISFVFPTGDVCCPFGFDQNLPTSFSSGIRPFVNEQSIWSAGRKICNVISASLDDIMANGGDATVTCYYSYPCCDCMKNPGSAVPIISAFAGTPNPDNFDVDPTVKVTMYGFKST